MKFQYFLKSRIIETSLLNEEKVINTMFCLQAWVLNFASDTGKVYNLKDQGKPRSGNEVKNLIFYFFFKFQKKFRSNLMLTLLKAVESEVWKCCLIAIVRKIAYIHIVCKKVMYIAYK